MSFKFGTAKVFALLILLFVIAYPSPAQTDSIYRLPAGTRMRLRMEGEISSKFSSPNDTFIARIAVPVVIREITVLPVGTVVEGRIVNAFPAGIGGRNGRIELRMETLRFADDVSRQIDGVPLGSLRAKRPNSLWMMIGGSAIGAAVGYAAGSVQGALIGTGLGAGAGAGATFLQKGNDFHLKEDDVFEIELKKEVVLPVRDY